MKKTTKKQAIIGVIAGIAILAGAYGLMPDEYVQMILDILK